MGTYGLILVASSRLNFMSAQYGPAQSPDLLFNLCGSLAVLRGLLRAAGHREASDAADTRAREGDARGGDRNCDAAPSSTIATAVAPNQQALGG